MLQRIDTTIRPQEAVAPPSRDVRTVCGGSTFARVGRSLLAGCDDQFVWASIAAAYGIPGLPRWAEWFEEELRIHHAITPAHGIRCELVIVRGDKEQFLDRLSWGIEGDPIQSPNETGSVQWPNLTLQIFCRTSS
jgi:hypothetical protein